MVEYVPHYLTNRITPYILALKVLAKLIHKFGILRVSAIYRLKERNLLYLPLYLVFYGSKIPLLKNDRNEKDGGRFGATFAQLKKNTFLLEIFSKCRAQS